MIQLMIMTSEYQLHTTTESSSSTMKLTTSFFLILHCSSTYGSLIEKLFTLYGEPHIRFNRSGYPKFPPTHSLGCGTRYINFIPERSPKIVGGVEPPYGSYPWQVDIKIYRYKDKKFVHHCGGALIGPRLVLTAAHCLFSSILPEHLRVVLGEHRLRKSDEHEASYKVDRLLAHPDFRKVGPHSHDIALLRLAGGHSGVIFSTYISPICLPHIDESPPPGTWCSVTGWGAKNIEDVDTISDTVQAAGVPILDPDTCRRPEINGGRQQAILDTMICAGRLQGGVDACGGDSGGPLSCDYQGRFVLAGLVSWGDGCAKKNRPGVYTRVSSNDTVCECNGVPMRALACWKSEQHVQNYCEYVTAISSSVEHATA
ncbi:uncharacterized protein CBL_13547, partial [Carabus blaptoides fortunei]